MAVGTQRALLQRRLWPSNQELIEWAQYLPVNPAKRRDTPPVTTRLLPRWKGDTEPIVAVGVGEGSKRVAIIAQQHGGKEPIGGLIARDLIRQAVLFGRFPRDLALRVYPRANPTGHALGIRRNGDRDKPETQPLLGYSLEMGSPAPLFGWSRDTWDPKDQGFNTNLCWDLDDVPEVTTVKQDLSEFKPGWLFDLHGMRLGRRITVGTPFELPQREIVGAVKWVASTEQRTRILADLAAEGADPAAIDWIRRGPRPAPSVVANSQRLAVVVADSMGFGATALPTGSWEGTVCDRFSLHGTATLVVESHTRLRNGLGNQPGSPEWIMPALEMISDGSISAVDPARVVDIPDLPYRLDRHPQLDLRELRRARGQTATQRGQPMIHRAAHRGC